MVWKDLGFGFKRYEFWKYKMISRNLGRAFLALGRLLALTGPTTGYCA
jgi:hypothetical protein